MCRLRRKDGSEKQNENEIRAFHRITLGAVGTEKLAVTAQELDGIVTVATLPDRTAPQVLVIHAPKTEPGSGVAVITTTVPALVFPPEVIAPVALFDPDQLVVSTKVLGLSNCSQMSGGLLPPNAGAVKV